MRTSVRSETALPRTAEHALAPRGAEHASTRRAARGVASCRAVLAALPCRVLGGAVLALLALSGAAQAQRLSPVTGEALMKLCTSKTPVGCDAYVSGVADEAELMGRSNGEPTDRNSMQFCIPADVKGSALRQTVVAWAQAHSEDSKLPAAMLVVHSFRASFPCRGGTPAGSAGVR